MQSLSMKTDNTTGFDRFWSAWPRSPRKGGKSECLKRWIKHHHETQADTIIKHVEWMKTTADWLKDSGSFIPMPITYLNQQRWDGAEIPEATTAPARKIEPNPYVYGEKARPSWAAQKILQQIAQKMKQH